MTLLIPVLAVAFAAFCVWLTVRIVNRRERWAKWTKWSAVGLLVMIVVYPLSVGPVLAFGIARPTPGTIAFVRGYSALLFWCAAHAPEETQTLIYRYVDKWLPPA